MADNLTTNPGAGGAVIATDEISGVHYPISKLAFGDIDNATLVSLANPMPVIGAFVKAEDTPSASGDFGIVLLAQRRDADSTAVDTDGDYATLKTDESGRLKVATQPASYALVSGNITASGQNVACDVSRASNVVVALSTAALAGHNCTFEGSLDSTNGTDGNWFQLLTVRSNSNYIDYTTGTMSGTPAYAWEASVNGCNWFRVRATSHTSGTATWKMQRGTYATEPIPAAQVSGSQPVSGTVTANLGSATTRAGFVAGAGIWYDDSSVALAASASFTGTSRDLTVTSTATAFASSSTYAKELRVSAESDQSGTLWLEVSRDNTNWRRVKSVATEAVAGGGQYAEIVHLPSWRYARVGFTNGATLQTRFSIGSILIAL